MVRLDGIGDFFIWMQSGALDASRYARTGGRKAILIANSAWADYARKGALWDEVLPVDPGRLTKNPLYRLRMLSRIRRLGAQVLVQPRAARIFLADDAIARISGAGVRIGNRGTVVNTTELLRRLGNRFYDRLISVDEARTLHETARNDEFVVGLTGRNATRVEFDSAADPSVNGPVVIALGAGAAGRVWPVENLAQLIKHIRRTHPARQVTLLGLAAELPTAARLNELAGGGLKSLVGMTQLEGFIEQIASAALIVCNDSSAYHIAMAHRKKVVCFLGGGHYGWFAPYPPAAAGQAQAVVLNVPMDCYWCNWRCKYPRSIDGAFRCIESISVGAAVAAVDGLLTAESGC